MRAYRLLAAQQPPAFAEVPDPQAGPGQVVVKVAGCGLCHTDFAVIAKEDWGSSPPPFTLGHEIAGWIEEVGPGVTNYVRGDAVAVMPGWSSCGKCHPCRTGEENACLHLTGIKGAGVGLDGGLAPYILVPSTRFVVPIPEGLDPVDAAPLTDAGLTTYTAIKPALGKLYPGATGVVIGIGGLGLLAVQFLRQLSGARVVAVDASEARLALATAQGADATFASGEHTAEQLREFTKGTGVQFVLDCVGIDATLATGMAALSRNGRMTVVGAGHGDFDFNFFRVPPGAELTTSLNGGSLAMKEVLDLAATGRVHSLVDRYPLSDAARAYDDLEHGRLKGRAVMLPDT